MRSILYAIISIGAFITAGALIPFHEAFAQVPANAPFKRLAPPAHEKARAPGNKASIFSTKRQAIAAPVDSVAADEAEDPEVRAIQAKELPIAVTDPEQVTAESGAVFEEEDVSNRAAVIRALNKVTAKFEDIIIPVGEEAQFGRLLVGTVSCRTSSKESQPDYAALLVISEHKKERYGPSSDLPREIFTGWIFASSPSLNGLEHAVYDISLLKCVDKETAASQATEIKQ